MASICVHSVYILCINNDKLYWVYGPLVSTSPEPENLPAAVGKRPQVASHARKTNKRPPPPHTQNKKKHSSNSPPIFHCMLCGLTVVCYELLYGVSLNNKV